MMSSPDQEIQDLSFEEAFCQLQQVIERLEQGELPLDKAIQQYEQGARLARLCENHLRKAELQVTQWQGNEGALKL